jgi:hypothetical protein
MCVVWTKDYEYYYSVMYIMCIDYMALEHYLF